MTDLFLFQIPEFATLYLLLIKLLLYVGGFLYLVFAFLVTRQVRLMKQTLETPLSPTMTLLGWVNFAFAVAVFVLFLMIL